MPEHILYVIQNPLGFKGTSRKGMDRVILVRRKEIKVNNTFNLFQSKETKLLTRFGQLNWAQMIPWVKLVIVVYY